MKHVDICYISLDHRHDLLGQPRTAIVRCLYCDIVIDYVAWANDETEHMQVLALTIQEQP